MEMDGARIAKKRQKKEDSLIGGKTVQTIIQGVFDCLALLNTLIISIIIELWKYIFLYLLNYIIIEKYKYGNQDNHDEG